MLAKGLFLVKGKCRNEAGKIQESCDPFVSQRRRSYRYASARGRHPGCRGVIARGLIPAGHKVAARAISQNEPVRRYGQIIGFATRPIGIGEHVHTHNLGMGVFEKDYAFATEKQSHSAVPNRAQFMGLARPDGRVETRNYIGILSSVNCSATVARAIADHFRKDIHPQELAGFPNVDGVVALTHSLGCAMDAEGEGLAAVDSAGHWGVTPAIQTSQQSWSLD